MRANEAAWERSILAWLSATSFPFSSFLKSSRHGHVCLRSGFLSVLPSADLRWGSCSSCQLCQAVIYVSLWEGLLHLYGIGNGTVMYISVTDCNPVNHFALKDYWKLHSGVHLLQSTSFNPFTFAAPLCVSPEVLFSSPSFVLPPQQDFINSLVLLRMPRIMSLLLIKNHTFPAISMHYF